MERNFRALVLGMGLALAAFSPAAAEEGALIQTNAREGSFRAGQRLWFSVAAGDRLRVLVDGEERYWGTGAAPVNLDAAAGEEREFRITAECYSPPPQSRMLDRRDFCITIDRKPPELPPVKIETIAGGFLRLSAELPPGVKAAAYVDTGENLRYIADLDEPLPPVPFSALIWAVDAAGNASAPLPRTFDFPGIRVENPVPGTWANPQRLLIFGAGGGELFWTDDGGDPLGPGGKAYTGPELIHKTGDVCLRLAYRRRDGHIQEEKIVYRVEPGGSLSPWQNGASAEDNPRFLEERNIQETMSLSLPDNFRWSIGGEPRDLRGLSELDGGNGLILRPQPGIRRALPLHLSAGGGIFRFILTLDGRSPAAPEDSGGFAPAPEDSGERTVDNIVFADGGAPAAWEEGGGPKIISAGNSRVLIWSASPGPIRYGWDNEVSWSSGSTPVCIPPGGGRLRWIIDRDDHVLGPFTVNIEARRMSKPQDSVRGRYAYRYVSPMNGGTDWVYVSGLFDAPSAAETKTFDVCDGEDIEWSFVTLKGESLRKWRVDRLAPPPPVFDAPGEGQWRRGPVRVSAEASGEEGRVKKIITARICYVSGTVEIISDTGPLVLKSASGEYAEVRLEARIEDASGNRGPPGVRNFILDPLTVYVSPLPGAPGTGEGDGGRDRPFHSLDAALEFARREGRRNICLNGSFQLQKDLIAAGDLVIDGSFNDTWERKGRTALAILPGVSLTAQRGTLKLRGLDLERRAEGPPFLRVLKGAGLELFDCGIASLGIALTVEEGSCVIRDTRMLSLTAGESRLPAIRAADSRMRILKSDFQLEGENGLCLEMNGGSLTIEDVRFRLSCRRTATALSLNRIRGEWRNLGAALAAGDYCSVLEIGDSELTVMGGSFSVKSRDAAAVLANNTELMFLGTEFVVNALFVARALEARNIFPHVRDCRFLFSGSSRRSEVFSGSKNENGRTVSLFPEPGTIGGNVFFAFTHLLDGAYPMESLAGFNRRFAPPGRPNVFRGAAPQNGGITTVPAPGGENDLLRN
jgi:hypothetical protein